MSIIRDIYDVIKNVDANGVPIVAPKIKDNRRYSIAKEANKGVLQFPVICSSLLSLEEATMINKALEREYVSFIRILTSIDSITDERDVAAYLKKFHQNFQQVSSRDIVTAMSSTKIMKESVDLPLYDSETSDTIEDLDKNMTELVEGMIDGDDMNDQEEFDMLTSESIEEDDEDEETVKEIIMSERSENEKLYWSNTNGAILHNLSENYIREIFIFKNNKEYFSFTTPKYKIEKISHLNENLDIINKNHLKEHDDGFRRDNLNDKFKPEKYRIISEMSSNTNKFGKMILDEDVTSFTNSSNVKDASADIKVRNVFDNNLTDNDVKKANELVPTTLHLKTYFKNEAGELQSIDYLIGVKTIIHVVQSNSMIENAVRGVKKNRKFFNLLKWTTGEISFFKDFLFVIPEIKDEIKSKYKDSKWWSALIRRRKYANALKSVNYKDQLVPNTSLIFSMEEVEQLKNESNIDLMDVKVATKLLSEYFLLGLVVIDSGAEVAHFLFDGQVNYMQHSYASLERENSNQAREVKNIMQILGKM